jgi:hypothetical protein
MKTMQMRRSGLAELAAEKELSNRCVCEYVVAEQQLHWPAAPPLHASVLIDGSC